MRLKRALIENYRAITCLELDLHPQMNVFFGGNAKGKTSVLNAVAVGLGGIQKLLPGISPVRFLDRDRRGTEAVRVELEAADGTRWERTMRGPRRIDRLAALKERLDPVVAAEEADEPPIDLPIAALYDTDRVVPERPQRQGKPKDFFRFPALQGALSPRPDFAGFFEWFFGKEHQEANERKLRRSFEYQLPELAAVRRAIESLVTGHADPMVLFHPIRFTVSVASDGAGIGRLEIDQLSGGQRTMLVVAADLARRMAQGNPHLDDPLHAEAVVLIDEVELHLHPSWQQTVLPDLMSTFPNAQFLVSTHSPQVLTTVEAERIIHLEREDGEIGAFGVPVSTYGARASDALCDVMGVDERPAGNGFVKDLRRYLDLVADGEGETAAARALRRELAEIAPDDPDLRRAALEIRHQRALRNLRRAK